MSLMRIMQQHLRRIVKYPVLVVFLVAGLLISSLLFASYNIRIKRIIAKYWFRCLLTILNLKLEIKGIDKDLEGNFLVANHISWLDIAVLSACLPTCFLSKSEIRRWPVIGLLARFVGTIFIARASRSALMHVNQEIDFSLRDGHSVCVFPEGTTTLGDQVGTFHSSIFQSALNAGAKITPVAIRYLDKAHARTDCPAYVGSMTLLRSLDQIVIEPLLIVEVSFLPTIDVKGLSRQSISDLSRAMILTDLFK
ncbi:MAG: lysophospholipid acyltransferase family protein [Proteobacteria bacterium]|nr:lysophospholipid acyltransferase family protein [Pseudomonadota bacterium]